MTPTSEILEAAHEAFISIDSEGLVVEFNPEAERTFGRAREEVIGRELAGLIVPERYRAAHREGLQRYAETETGTGRIVGRRLEMSAIHHDGHEFPVEMTISAIRAARDEGERLTFHAFLHDISERKRAEWVLVAMQSVTQAMARAESPVQAMASLLAALGASMDWKAGNYWQLADDGALDRTAGWSADPARTKAFDDLSASTRLPPDTSLPGRAVQHGEPVWIQDCSVDDGFIRAQTARKVGLHAAIAVPVLRKGNTIAAIELLACDPRARDPSISGALAAIGVQVGELLGVLEERQALLTSLARLALTDQLTGLPNRRAWEDALRRELARAERDGHPVCVAVIDLDEFKAFNDQHGHQAGDAMLARAARAWLGQLRASDLLARYGGEEFAALIPAWPIDTAVAVVERLRAATPPGLTASAGVASWNRGEPAAELFGRADAALYEAKQAGRDRTVAAT
jgi:diguanylate cyclase (GGDEF)-like protein/PAS domain S-box-containing protein